MFDLVCTRVHTLEQVGERLYQAMKHIPWTGFSLMHTGGNYHLFDNDIWISHSVTIFFHWHHFHIYEIKKKGRLRCPLPNPLIAFELLPFYFLM